MDSKYIILCWTVYRLGGHWWEYSIAVVGRWLYVISTYYYIISRKIRKDIFSWDFISKFTAVRFVIVEDIDLTFFVSLERVLMGIQCTYVSVCTMEWMLSRSNNTHNPSNGNESVPTHISNNESTAAIPTKNTLNILFTILTNLNLKYNFSTTSQLSPNFKRW